MCRHKVWSIRCSLRNALQFLWELSSEVTWWAGEMNKSHSRLKCRISSWQRKWFHVSLSAHDQWEEGRKQFPLSEEKERRCKGERCEQIVQGLEAGSTARKMALISFKSRSYRSTVTSTIYLGHLSKELTNSKMLCVAARGGPLVHRYQCLSRENFRAQCGRMLQSVISDFLVWLTQGHFNT